MAASRSLCLGTINPLKCSARALIAIGKTPFAGCNFPSRPNSPSIMYSPRESAGICPSAARMAMARGRSKPLPSFLRSAGAMFTVMSALGNFMPLYCIAAAMRSRPSLTATSPRPVRWYMTPFSKLTSMVTVVT